METNPAEPPAVESATEQGIAVLQVVQGMVADPVKAAMSSSTHELLEVVQGMVADSVKTAMSSSTHELLEVVDRQITM